MWTQTVETATQNSQYKWGSTMHYGLESCSAPNRELLPLFVCRHKLLLLCVVGEFNRLAFSPTPYTTDVRLCAHPLVYRLVITENPNWRWCIGKLTLYCEVDIYSYSLTVLFSSLFLSGVRQRATNEGIRPTGYKASAQTVLVVLADPLRN